MDKSPVIKRVFMSVLIFPSGHYMWSKFGDYPQYYSVLKGGYIYKFFDNATVAAAAAVILTIAVGGVIASWQYRKQKKIDRENVIKKEIIDSFELINGKIRYAIFILDRIVNTTRMLGKPSEILNEVFKKSINDEFSKLSITINEDIPLLEIKIDDSLFLCFPENEDIQQKYKKFKEDLKKWHSFIIAIPSKGFDFSKNTSEITELSIENIKPSIRDLIRMIHKIEV